MGLGAMRRSERRILVEMPRMDPGPPRLRRTAGRRPIASLTVASAAELAVEGLLDSLHGVKVLLLCSAFLHLLGIQNL